MWVVVEQTGTNKHGTTLLYIYWLWEWQLLFCA